MSEQLQQIELFQQTPELVSGILCKVLHILMEMNLNSRIPLILYCKARDFYLSVHTTALQVRLQSRCQVVWFFGYQTDHWLSGIYCKARDFILQSQRFCLRFGIYLIFLFQAYAQTFQAQAIVSENEDIHKALAVGKYNFEDLFEAGKILVNQNNYSRAQVVLELALQLQSKNLEVYRLLAIVYEKTEQSDKLSEIARAVSSYLLPQGQSDEFYEKMLSFAIVLSSESDPEQAWQIFQRLHTSLKYQPSRLFLVIKRLENEASVPFVARLYEYLEKRGEYKDFLWGKLGDWFLYKGDPDKAIIFFEKEFRKKGFDFRLLYSMALAQYEKRNFSMSQVFLNLARRLNQEESVLEKIEELQRGLSEHVYDVGVDQILKEAEYLLAFSKKKEGLERLMELTLLNQENADSIFEMGMKLIGYPSDYGVFEEGRDLLVRYAKHPDASMLKLVRICDRFLQEKKYEDIAAVLKEIKQRFPVEYESSPSLKIFRQKVTHDLQDQIRLFENYATQKELKTYLQLLISFEPQLLKPWISLCEVLEAEILTETKERNFLSLPKMDEVLSWLDEMEKILRLHPTDFRLSYHMARLMSLLGKKRVHSREISWLRRSLSVNSDFQEARVLLARSYHDFGFYRQSVTMLEQFFASVTLGDHPLKQEAKNLLIANYLKIARNAWGNQNWFLVIESVEAIQALLGGEIYDKETTIWLAKSRYQVQKPQGNPDLLKKAITRFGEDGELYYLLAISQENMNQIKEAILSYEKALSLLDVQSPFHEECEESRKYLQDILQYAKPQ